MTQTSPLNKTLLPNEVTERWRFAAGVFSWFGISPVRTQRLLQTFVLCDDVVARNFCYPIMK